MKIYTTNTQTLSQWIKSYVIAEKIRKIPTNFLPTIFAYYIEIKEF